MHTPDGLTHLRTLLPHEARQFHFQVGGVWLAISIVFRDVSVFYANSVEPDLRHLTWSALFASVPFMEC